MPGSQRRRGFVATPEGLERLKDAKFKGEYTYESLAEVAGVGLDQVKRLFNPLWECPIERVNVSAKTGEINDSV